MAAGHCTVRLGSNGSMGGLTHLTLTWEPFFGGTFSGSISGKHFFGKFGKTPFLEARNFLEIRLQMGWKMDLRNQDVQFFF